MLTATLIALTVIALITPVIAGKELNVQRILGHGFLKYLNKQGIDLDDLSQEEANDIFNQFIADTPKYGGLLNKFYEQTGQYGEEVGDLDVTYDELQDADALTEISTFENTIDGVTYTVEVREIQLDDGTIINKVSYIDPNGTLADPYIYVKFSYLYWWSWWGVKYRTGEFAQVYYKFMKNVNGINEAARYRYKVQELLNYATLGIGTLITILAPFTYGLTAIAGVVWAYMVIDINNELAYAYINTNNYLKVTFRVSYNYAWIGSWYDAHTIWGDGSWHMMGLPNIDASGAKILLDGFKGLGRTYGYNRWVWVGVYYG